MRNERYGSYEVMQKQLMELCTGCEYVQMATQYDIADTTNHFLCFL